MKKNEQMAINNEVLEVYYSVVIPNDVNWQRLRTCSAYVCTTNNFYVLKSYNTIIAVIDRNTDTCYDFLRKVYGYTSTSAQHITKFKRDYGAGKWGCENTLTYRPV